jgi:hypothetical protein
MRISSTDVIEGGRVLYAIGKIEAASAWHAANGAPLQDNWRELALSELIRRAEDIDADAIIGLEYETDISFRSKRLGCNSSAFSPPASRSSFLARRSARSSKSCRLIGADFSDKIWASLFSNKTRPTAVANITLELGFTAMCGKPLIIATCARVKVRLAGCCRFGLFLQLMV